MARSFRQVLSPLPLVLQVELLEDRRLLSSSGPGRRFAGPPPHPPAIAFESSRAREAEDADSKGHSHRADVVPPGPPGSVGATRADEVARADRGNDAGSGHGAGNNGRGHDEGRGRSEVTTGEPGETGGGPDGRGSGADPGLETGTNSRGDEGNGRGYGLAVNAGQDSPAPGKAIGKATLTDSGPGFTPPGLGDAASPLVRSADAAGGPGSVVVGRTGGDPGAAGLKPIQSGPSTAKDSASGQLTSDTSDRLPSEQDDPGTQESSDRSGSNRVASDHSDAKPHRAARTMVTIPLGPEEASIPAVRDIGNPNPSQADQLVTRPNIAAGDILGLDAASFAVGSEVIVYQPVPALGDLHIATAHPSAGPRGVPAPEGSDLGADPTTAAAQALLGELRALLDGLQAAGQDALGGLSGREVSQWLLVALVVAVTVSVARRELREAEVNSRKVEGEGALVPWLV